jgi:aconitase A
MTPETDPVTDISGARVLALLGDSVTTDHISPAGSIKPDSPAGQYLTEHGVQRRDFNSYGSRRGNHEVMIRGTFANIRLRNLLLANEDGTVVQGGFTRNHLAGGEQTTTAQSLGLDGTETFDITGITELNEGRIPRTVHVRAGDVEFDAVVRIDTPGEADYYRNGGIMPYVLRKMIRSG